MNDVTLKVGFDIDKFNQELKKTNSALSSWASGIKGIAGTIGIAFGIQQVASFGLEVSKLAGEAEGVRAAFEKLPGSIKLMMELKEATGNTVSEFALMKRTVQASNFGISLGALPKLLEFATIRAQQTGQSVDYLVDSIVTGIGRKSPLILDNLGISAVALKEKLGDVSIGAATVGDVAEAVGKIAGESLKTMGSLSDNASTKIQKLSGSWENLKVAIGDAANGTGILGTGLDALSATLDVLSSKNLSFFDKLSAFISPGGVGLALGKDYAENIKKAGEEQKKFDSVMLQATQAIETFGFNLEAISGAYKQNINFTEIYNEVLKRQKDQSDKAAESMNKQAEAAKKLAEEMAKIYKPSVNTNFGTGYQSANAGIPISGVGMPDKVGGVDLDAYFADADAALTRTKELRKELQGVQVDISASTASFISDLAYTIGQSINGTVDFGQAVLKAIANFAKSFGEQLIALGVARIALEYLWENPYAAIAAGAALVLAAGIVSSSAKSGISSLTSGGSGSSGAGHFPSQYTGNQRANDIYNYQVTFKIRGQDLEGSLQMAKANNRITKGP